MIKEQLKKDLIQSMKSGDQLKRSLIGMVMSSIKNRELDKRGRLNKAGGSPADNEEQSLLNDEEVIDCLMSEVKKRKESFQQFQAAGRPELAEKEQAEIDILNTYLPEQVSEAELRQAIADSIAETGAKDMKDMGKVVGAVMAKFKGKTEGGIVSALVKEALS